LPPPSHVPLWGRQRQIYFLPFYLKHKTKAKQLSLLLLILQPKCSSKTTSLYTLFFIDILR
jgi:hypothetical protein